MTYRSSDSSCKSYYSQPQSRLNQQIKPAPKDEGCPVLEESGSVCGETESLNVFLDFKKIYDDCLKKLERTADGKTTLKKLAPFQRLIDHLWEQNAMLIETVGELEDEAACRLSTLQDKLNKSCQKELHCTLRTKEREVESLSKELSEKNDLLSKYCCQIEDLKNEMKNKCKKFHEVIKRLKSNRQDGSTICDGNTDDNVCDSDGPDFEELLFVLVKNVEEQRKSVIFQLQSAECQLRAMASEKKAFMKERNEIANQIQCLKAENEMMVKELAEQKKTACGKEDLMKTIEILKMEKNELTEKVKVLHENIQELNTNFKETRWALTSEVAEKHDKVQELRKCVTLLEEQLRQADMQTHFKDDIIKELRKELKSLRKTTSEIQSPTKLPASQNLSPTQLIEIKPPQEKKETDDELKLDIHIFPINDLKNNKPGIETERFFQSTSVEIQTDPCQSPPTSKMRNVSTQHKIRVQKLPRSFGTLIVTPWSKATGETVSNDVSSQDGKEDRKSVKGIYTVPFSENRGLYDVVNEVREQKNSKNSCISTSTFVCENKKAALTCMSNCKCPASQYPSPASFADGKTAPVNDVLQHENAKLRSEIDRLKKCLKTRLEQFKEQEEFTKDLEEKLAIAKMDLTALQEKNDKQEGRSRSLGFISVSESGFNRHCALLSSITHKIEEILECLSAKLNCNSNCKTLIEQEMEKLRAVKSELEKNKMKNVPSESNSANYKSCAELFRSQENKCSLVHIDDVEKFREKAITGVVALEKMREQIEILENLIKKYLDNFPCNCDKLQIKECEEKLEKFHIELDGITGQLCSLLQKVNKSVLAEESIGSFSSIEPLKSVCTDASLISEEMARLRCECSRLEKEICDQENAVETLKQTAKDLEQEIRCKRMRLAEQTTEIDSRACEIIKTRGLIQKLCHRLREQQCSRTKIMKDSANTPLPQNVADLGMLFCDLNELSCLLEKSAVEQRPISAPEKFMEENDKLKEKLECLEKCINNKEETLRLLQDTVKLKECQIEELKSKMEKSENQSSKLTEEVEEKCRLISNLQEAIRKCKQFEAQAFEVEALQFDLCDLECAIKTYEKEIGRKSRVIEGLHEKVTYLSSNNFNLTEKINIIEPKLKVVYKTCALFEKMVCDLQEVIRGKEEEIEALHGKIKELENELESEFKKWEYRALEDSKCIGELNMRLQNFQTEYSCAQENYSASLAVLENRLKNEQDASNLRERELNNTICQLKMELKAMQNQLLEKSSLNDNSSKISELENLLKQAECRLQMYGVRVTDLQKALECTSVEREEERKNMLQKICDEKKENIKNKALITKLNESIKLTSLNEKILKDRIENFIEDNDSLIAENEELRTEIEARKKIMSASEKDDGSNLSELEKLICSLKIQKSELKNKCFNLRTEIDKEVKLRKILECRVEDLNGMLQKKLHEFNRMIDTYKCTSSRLQQTLSAIKEVEKNFMCIEHKMRENLENESELDEFEYLKKLLNIKTAENAKLICQMQVLQVELESMRNENILVQTNNESMIAQLRHEVNCLENAAQELEVKCRKLDEENKKLHRQLDCMLEKESSMQIEFKEKQKELCGKLRNAICEKNDLLNSLDELQKQLEQLCLDNVTKEKINRELSEECSRLKLQTDSSDTYSRSKSEKIICNLRKEIKSLHCELSTLKENCDALDKEYKDLLIEYKFCEKKKCNLEKLYVEVSNENQMLLDLKMKYERDLCELNNQNQLLKDKLASNGENFRDSEEKQLLCEKIKELTMKVRTLEKRVIPGLEEEIAQKNCCIENLRVELREANISSQRIRSEAVRVIQCTKKYLAAQRCANETLKSRLECSNKRGNILGAENRELEEQLKAVTRMNEFLLNQLESNKSEVSETEPRSFSPLPWSCSTVERDTSSSEYLAESGFQSMQPSPTNMDIECDSQRGNTQWNNSKKNKYGGSIDCSSYRKGMK